MAIPASTNIPARRASVVLRALLLSVLLIFRAKIRLNFLASNLASMPFSLKSKLGLQRPAFKADNHFFQSKFE
jgi:hypothetical protein